MNILLTKYLEKLGIKNPNELKTEERVIFDNWQTILSKETLALEDIKQFCQTQVSIIESKWSDYNLEQVKKAELIPYHTVYKTLLVTIDSPKAVRVALENQLNQLINT